MPIHDYTIHVRRLGGPKYYLDGDGRRYNLNRQHQISWDEVETDGAGNITKMPFLRRVPCFGRPERFVRGLYSAFGIPEMLTSCERCPSIDACLEVAIERINSAPEVDKAFCAWDDVVRPYKGKRCFAGRAGLLWEKFLHAIIRHGGWTNTNDAEVFGAEIVRQEERSKAKRLSATRSRAKKRAERDRRDKISPELAAKIDAARNKLCQDLLALRVTKTAPLWLRQMDRPGCIRTADVWRANMLLRRQNAPATLSAIARLLITRGDVRDVNENSLRTKVGVILKRLERIEMFPPEHRPPAWL